MNFKVVFLTGFANLVYVNQLIIRGLLDVPYIMLLNSRHTVHIKINETPNLYPNYLGVCVRLNVVFFSRLLMLSDLYVSSLCDTPNCTFKHNCKQNIYLPIVYYFSI